MTVSTHRQGSAYTTEGGPALVKDRAEKTMARVDGQPEPVRRLVHEYGWLAVSSLLDNGITNPRLIETIINSIRNSTPACPIMNDLRAERRVEHQTSVALKMAGVRRVVAAPPARMNSLGAAIARAKERA